MPSVRINKQLNLNETYFITLVVRDHVYLFDRYNRWQILGDTLRYFINNKKLLLIGFVFMLNHIHLMINSPDCIAFIRDYKKYTSKKLLENIKMSEPNLLELFREDDTFRIWEKANMPIHIFSEKFYNQKLNYIHYNPVKKGYVIKPEFWHWSSANPICEVKVSF